MADLTNRLIPTLIGGVSQLADGQRDPSQAAIQENAVSSLTQGLRKREGAQLLTRLADRDLGDAFIHLITRDQSERYLVIFDKAGVVIWDIESNCLRPVDYTAGLPYLQQAVSPKEDLRASTLADYTFLTNTRVKPAMLPDVAPERARPVPHEALIWIKAAVYGQSYVVRVNRQEVTVDTPLSPTEAISTTAIAQQIRAALEPLTPELTWDQKGAVLHVYGQQQIQVGVNDSQSNNNITAITDSVQAFTELPAVAPQGYQIHVEGDPGNQFDDYYIEFRVRSGQGDFGEGSWVETVAPGTPYKINDRTMPHVLVSLANGSFWFGPAAGQSVTGATVERWGRRTAGDLTSAPDPSFIGRPINDVFVWRNRLGFLADEAVILSRPGEFFDFFPETVTTTLATDPIDLFATGERVSIMRYAVIAQDELLIFADQTQFRMSSGDQPLTAETAALTILTRYEIDIRVRPVQVGPNVVFCQTNGEWSRFRDYRLRGVGPSVAATADDLTQLVPSYVPSGVFKIAVEETAGSWYALSDATNYRAQLAVNKFAWRSEGDGTVRQQNSWGTWTFSGIRKILSIEAFDEQLYMVTVSNQGHTWLERIPVSDPSPMGRTQPKELLLDHWITVRDDPGAQIAVGRGRYDPTTDLTRWYLPFTVTGRWEAWTRLTRSSGEHLLGWTQGGNKIEARGDWSQAAVVFGVPIKFRYRFTTFKAYSSAENSNIAVAYNEYRTQLRQAKLRYHDSDWFEVVVLAEGREPAHYIYGPTIHNRNNRIGQPPWTYDYEQETRWQRDGVFTIPLMAKGDSTFVELLSDVPRPCKFVSVEWLAVIASKARR